MALDRIKFNIASFNDTDADGNNYYAGIIYEVFNSNDTLADIYSDAAGANPINQDGISNKSNSSGEAIFYIDSGSYYIKVDEKVEYFSTLLSSGALISDLSQSYNFDSVESMINSEIIFPQNKVINVTNDDGVADVYLVQLTETDIELNGGLYAKRIPSYAGDNFISSTVEAGDINNHFDDNEIIDSTYGAFVKSGVSMSNVGVLPQTVSGGGTSDAALFSAIDYSKDWIYYAKMTANAAGVSSVRLGGSGDTQADVIEISFNYNHVTSLPEVGTISINFFDSTQRVLYTGAQFADFAIVYDSKYDVFYMLNRGNFSFYTEIADRVVFSNVSKTLSTLSYINDALGSLTINHSKLCKPNYIAIGDSLCGGDNFFSPNPSQGWDDYNHQWESHANAEGINTVIINRGVGGQRSDAITARIQSDVIDQGARQAYLHLSTNDARDIMGGPMDYSTRTSNVQSGINLMLNSGIQTILINSVYSNLNDDYAEYYQNYLTDSDGFRNLTNYKTWVDQMLVLADSSGRLDPVYTDPDGTHLNTAGYTLMGNTISVAAFSPTETVNRVTTNSKFNFNSGLQSRGIDVNTKPSGWAVIEPVSGSLDYKVSVFTEGADRVVLGAYRETGSEFIIHIVFSESVEPAVLSTYGEFSTNDAGIAMFTGTVNSSSNTKVARYFANLLFNTGVSGVSIPTAIEMENLAWFVRF